MLINGIASSLKISPESIEIVYVSRGSVRVTLEMEEKGAEQLFQMYLKNDPSIKELGISNVSIRLIGSSEILPPLLPQDPQTIASNGIIAIREKLIENPLLGSEALSVFIRENRELLNYQDIVDTLRSKLKGIYKDGEVFGWDQNQEAEKNRTVHSLLNISSQIET